MDFSDDEKHNASLLLLAEAAEYLRRMPPVWTTRKMAERIEAHLLEPTSVLVAQRSYRLIGATHSVVGMPTIKAHVRDSAVTVQWGPEFTDHAARLKLCTALELGVTIPLRPDPDPPNEDA